MSDKAILTIGDRQFELPVIAGTEGERAIDIRELRDQTGLITFDPGFGNTGSCKSAITFIDGEKGILRYRGIPIEQFTDEAQLRRGGLAADLRPPADAGRVRRLRRGPDAPTP